MTAGPATAPREPSGARTQDGPRASERRPAPPPPEPATDEIAGTLSISESVVAKIAARAATELPDVGAAAPRVLGRLGIRESDLAGLPKTSADIDGRRTYVDMTIGVRWPASVPAVVSSLRRHVRAQVETLTGLRLADLRITVADLITERPAGRRVR